MSSTPSQTTAPSSATRRPRGWATFVGVYLAVAGALNLIWGIAALANKSYFHSGGLVWAQLNTWGWIAIILGALQLLGSGLVFSRRPFGAVIAGFLAFLGILLNFLAIGAYPIWSAVLLVVDGLIIWAVTVHADEFAD